jgi:hypothetical protein
LGHNGYLTFCRMTAGEERHVSQRIFVVHYCLLMWKVI